MIHGDEFTRRREERDRSKPILPAEGYYPSRNALGNSTQTMDVVLALESYARLYPYATPALPGTIVRVVCAHPYGDYPSVRLFYSVDKTAIRFLRIEQYDEMEP